MISTFIGFVELLEFFEVIGFIEFIGIDFSYEKFMKRGVAALLKKWWQKVVGQVKYAELFFEILKANG